MLQEDMKIAIVGLGGMGDWHRELIESIDGLTLAGIYDIKEERQEYAKEKKIRVYASFEELLADSSNGLSSF